MILPKLYSRTSTGATQTWEIEIDSHKYRTISGQKDGKKTVSEWTECEGKSIGRSNETTPAEQAIRDATSTWERKKKSGGYHENELDIDFETFLEPMLAKHFKDRLDKIVYPVLVDRKYNGMRCITKRTGMFTRKGEPILSAPHIFEAVKHLFKQFPDLVIDGELYNHEYRYKLNEIISLVRRTKNITAAHLAASKEKIKYYVYDGFEFVDRKGYIDMQTANLVRREGMNNLLSGITEVVCVDHGIARNEQDVWDIYQTYVDDGYEGAMVRINAAYKNGRSSNLLKVKPEDDDEFELVDVVEGIGNRSGMAGKVIVKMKDGRTFGCGMKGETTQFQEVLRNKQNYIGLTVTIKYNGFTGKGIPNYGQFDCNNYNKGDR